MHGFVDGSYDYRHMYSITDRKGLLPKPTIHPNTLWSVIVEHYPDYQHLVEQIPRLVDTFNNPHTRMTVFIPNTISNSLCTPYTIRQFLLLHSIDRRVEPFFLQSSGMMYLNSRLATTKLIIENRPSGLFINGYSKILRSIPVGQSIIYIIDRSLPFEVIV